MSVVTESCSKPQGLLALEGPLRIPINSQLKHQVRGLLRTGQRAVVLDLARVPAIDAGGVGELVRAFNLTTAVDGSMRIVRPTPRVRRTLAVAGLLGLFGGDCSDD